MVFWILAAVVLHAVYVFTPAALFLPAEGAMRHLGARDELPEPSVMVGRARRALANWQESLPVFVVLALAAMIVDGAEAGATTGAAVFVLARLAYLPLYLVAIPGLRSAAWIVAIAGLVMMALALV